MEFIDMCDTFVVVRPEGVILAKNSDRDPNEAQRLDWIAAREHPPESRVHCTWTHIPQVARTNALVISRPYWMWGAEMGANEHGVAIGNEALFARGELLPGGLTGMDLLRLALERAASASEAVQVIRSLLERHGQGGEAGYARRDVAYHNSFLIADRHEAWLLESVGRDTESERICEGVRAISNAPLTPRLRRRAKRFHSLVARADRRQARTECLAATVRSAADAMQALCDHGEGAAAPRFSRMTGALGAPCVHAGGWLAAAQTTGSWVSALSAAGDRHWATGTSSPCLSLFRPLTLDRPRHTGAPTGQRDAESLWWRHEGIHRAMRTGGWTPPASFHADRVRTQTAILADADSGWALAEDFLERWEGVSKQTTPRGGPRWLRRYWQRISRESNGPSLRSARAPE